MKDDGRNDDDDGDDRTWFLGLRVVGDGESSQRIHTHRVRPNTQKLWVSSDNLKWVAMVGNGPHLAIFWYIFPEFPGLSKNCFSGGYPSVGSYSREYNCFKRNPFTIIHDVCVYYCVIYIYTLTVIYILMKSSIQAALFYPFLSNCEPRGSSPCLRLLQPAPRWLALDPTLRGSVIHGEVQWLTTIRIMIRSDS